MTKEPERKRMKYNSDPSEGSVAVEAPKDVNSEIPTSGTSARMQTTHRSSLPDRFSSTFPISVLSQTSNHLSDDVFAETGCVAPSVSGKGRMIRKRKSDSLQTDCPETVSSSRGSSPGSRPIDSDASRSLPGSSTSLLSASRQSKLVDRTSLNESTNLIKNGTGAAVARSSGSASTPPAETPRLSGSSNVSKVVTPSTKDNEQMRLMKARHINHSSKTFQSGIMCIISRLSQLNGRDVPKADLCTLQMCVLLHSGNCKKLSGCTVPQCTVIKSVLRHMTSCSDGNCKVTHCRASIQLINHWNRCSISTCSACRPILDIGQQAMKAKGENVDVLAINANQRSQTTDDGLLGQDVATLESGRSHVVIEDDGQMAAASPADSATGVTAADASPIDVVISNIKSSLLSKTGPPLAGTAAGVVDRLKSEASQPSTGKTAWTGRELVDCMLPLLETLWTIGKESVPFQQPVNPVRDLCPDYYEVIKCPMDMSTIRKKLLTSDYKEPWQFISDFYLMLRNAWTYNHRKSKYFAYATKLANAFESRVDGVMQSLGYCCGHQYHYNPLPLNCYTANSCSIRPYAFYYVSKNYYVVCESCFLHSNDNVNVIDERTQTTVSLPKTSFVREKNAYQPPEDLVPCIKCGRKFHSVCVRYVPELWPNEYICKNCVMFYSITNPSNKYRAADAAKTSLSDFLEERLNAYLKKRKMQVGRIHIRVLSSTTVETVVMTRFKKHFPEGPDAFPYVSKVIFAFQEDEDGADVCFFCMRVQEYGSDVPAPNTRCVYLAYMDSVHYFKPSHARTDVYHEIILGYMAYVKQRGFERMFIWSCPPSPGDDYIFNCHPPEQKTPKAKRLQDWYELLLRKAPLEKIVYSFKNIFIYALETNLKSASELPYFSGDYWPSALEDSLKELDAQNATEGSSDDQPNKPQKKKGSKAKGSKVKGVNGNILSGDEALTEKLYTLMKRHKESFFVIEFYRTPELASLPRTIDQDGEVFSDLVNCRSSFLVLARESHYEFSTVRRTKYSTLCLFRELYRRNNCGISCNSCNISIVNSDGLLFCKVCQDFKMCLPCYEANRHEHQMVQTWWSNAVRKKTSELLALSNNLEHSSACTKTECSEQNCPQWKKILAKWNNCNCSGSQQQRCRLCRQLLSIAALHAKSCQKQICTVPYCKDIRQRQHKLQCAQKEDEARVMRRRMKQMETEPQSEESAAAEKEEPETTADAATEMYDGKGSPPSSATQPSASCSGQPPAAGSPPNGRCLPTKSNSVDRANCRENLTDVLSLKPKN